MPSIHNKDKKKRLLLKRQNGRCWICNLPMRADEITFDHLIPKSKRGGSDMPNLKLAHRACNEARGNSVDGVFIENDGVRALRWHIRSIGRI